MAFSFSDLKANRPKLEPVPVDIGGLAEPLLIHQFTMNELSELTDEAKQEPDDEKRLRIQIVKLLNGPGTDVTDEDCAELSRIFTSWQLREIYQKSLTLNGHGPEALREAEKN